MHSRSIRRCCLLLLAICGIGPASSHAGEWALRLYGYQPRVYGYAPSQYVFPRYGLKRGYVYFERPPYGSPQFGDPNHVPPCPLPPPDEMLLPVETIETPPSLTDSQASRPTSRRVR